MRVEGVGWGWFGGRTRGGGPFVRRTRNAAVNILAAFFRAPKALFSKTVAAKSATYY